MNKVKLELELNTDLLAEQIVRMRDLNFVGILGKELIDKRLLGIIERQFKTQIFDYIKDNKIIDKIIDDNINEFTKDSVNDFAPGIINKYLQDNKDIPKLVNKFMDKYLKSIDFKQLMLDLFSKHKDLFMENFMKSMFTEKADKK